MKKQTSEVISKESLVNELNRVLNLGLDVHYRQVTVAMQEDAGRIKAAGKMSYGDFLNWVGKKLEEGWEINSAANDLVEIGVISTLKKAGASCSGGYLSNWHRRHSNGSLLDPPLTTVCQPIYQMGRHLIGSRTQSQRCPTADFGFGEEYFPFL